MIFVASNLLILGCIPLRVLQAQEGVEDRPCYEEVSCQKYYRIIEESLLVFGVPGSWFYLMFFAG